MRKNNKNKKGFTLIELLVVIAIIAILAVVVILTLNPAELLRQARDSNRVSDFATLKSSIGLYSADVATTTWLGAVANTSTIYESSIFSLTTPTTTTLVSAVCGANPGYGWGFVGETQTSTPTVAATARLVNGTGWIPINFTAISSGAPIGSLPVDPVNNGANVYAFVGAQTSYKLATKTESVKYSNGGTADVESTDGGNSACAYEQGTNITGL